MKKGRKDGKKMKERRKEGKEGRKEGRKEGKKGRKEGKDTCCGERSPCVPCSSPLLDPDGGRKEGRKMKEDKGR